MRTCLENDDFYFVFSRSGCSIIAKTENSQNLCDLCEIQKSMARPVFVSMN